MNTSLNVKALQNRWFLRKILTHMSLLLLMVSVFVSHAWANCTNNIALGKTVVTSSVESSDQGYFPGYNVTDGNSNTRWASDFYNSSDPDNEWIYVNLSSSYQICKVIIKWQDAYAEDYDLEYWNSGSGWVNIKQIRNNHSTYNEHSNLNVNAQYIRMKGIKRGTQYGYSIYEFEIYSGGGGGGGSPDYYPFDLKVNNSTNPTVSPGQSVSASVWVKNQGAGSSTAHSKGSFYYNHSNTLSGAQYLTYSDLQPMAPGEQHIENVTFNIPGNAQTGTRYILFKADGDDEISESNESNNIISIPIYLNGVSYPDYYPFDLKVNNSTNPTVSAGQSVAASVWVKNQGAGSSTVHSKGSFYYNHSNTISGAQYLTYSDLQPMAPGEQHIENVTFNIPNNAQTGTRYILFKADGDDEISESNESNNIISIPIYVNVVLHPDYYPFDLKVNSSTNPTVSAGQSVSASAWVKNQGTGSSTVHSKGSFYYNHSNTISGAQYLTYSDLQPMAPGEQHIENVTFNIPGSAQTGTRYILFKADGDDEISESNESNNIISIPITIISQVNANFTASPTSICQGETVSFTNQSSGSPTSYSWNFSPSTVSYTNGTGPSSANPVVKFNGSGNYTVSLTASNSGASDVETKTNYISVSASTTPTVSITASKTAICSGEAVNFTANVSGGGTAPTYQWKVNGTFVSSAVVFQTNALNNGDQVSLTILSNAPCASPTTASSNTVVMNVSNSVVPTASISASKTTICSGEAVSFTANIVGGGTAPTYQWKVNGTFVSSAVVYQTNALNNGDQVSLTILSNAPCASPTTASSNTIVMNVSNSVVPTVSISPSTTTICSGEAVSFTANIVGGGTAPTYQWKVNGTFVSSAVVYQTNALNNGDQVSLTILSNAPCASPTIASSNTVVMNVSTSVTPTVSISPNTTTFCSGETVSFTANIVGGGTAPTYQWKVNGTFVSSAVVYQTNALNNGDQVSLTILSNAPCASPTTASSNTVVMNVSSSVTPTVSISPSATTICSGDMVSFTANVVHGGTAPTYQWKVNGTFVSSAVVYQTNTLNNGDQISLTILSNAPCASPTTASSNTVVISEDCNDGPDTWPVVETGSNHTVVIPITSNVTINGQSVQIGDYIGAFYNDNGQLKCAGKEKWTGQSLSISVYGDDNTTNSKDGFSPNEVFTWKIWQKSTGEEFLGTATYRAANGNPYTHQENFAVNGISGIASLNGTRSQRHDITLRPGWNMVSTYINPDQNSIADIFAPVQNNIAIVKNVRGQSFLPSIPINGIGAWNVKEGYQVKVLGNSALNLSIEGEKVNPANYPISLPTLVSGWSIISYLRDTEQPIATALAPILSEVIIVKTGSQSYIPSEGINQIGTMKPGVGYYIKTRSSTTLSYNARMATPPANMHRPILTPSQYRTDRMGGDNATIIIRANGILNYGDEVGIFDKEGNLVGAGVYEDYTLALPVWGDDPTTPETDGLQEGEEFDIRVWRSTTSQEEKLVFTSKQNAAYQTNAILDIELMRTTDVSANLLVENSLIIYPNPAERMTNLALELKEHAEVKAAVYDLSGKLMLSISNQHLPTGRHEFSISTTQLPEGMYHCQILVNGVIHNIPFSVMK